MICPAALWRSVRCALRKHYGKCVKDLRPSPYSLLLLCTVGGSTLPQLTRQQLITSRKGALKPFILVNGGLILVGHRFYSWVMTVVYSASIQLLGTLRLRLLSYALCYDSL